MFLYHLSLHSVYLLIISETDHFNEASALSASVITGVNKCGHQLYQESSTIFGSIIINFNSFGEF
jgi:hypothetical protein